MQKEALEADKLYLIHDNKYLYQITIDLKEAEKFSMLLADDTIQQDLKVCSFKTNNNI